MTLQRPRQCLSPPRATTTATFDDQDRILTFGAGFVHNDRSSMSVGKVVVRSLRAVADWWTSRYGANQRLGATPLASRIARLIMIASAIVSLGGLAGTAVGLMMAIFDRGSQTLLVSLALSAGFVVVTLFVYPLTRVGVFLINDEIHVRFPMTLKRIPITELVGVKTSSVFGTGAWLILESNGNRITRIPGSIFSNWGVAGRREADAVASQIEEQL